MAYPSYNSQFYMQDLQNMRDRIDNQMRQIQQQQNQIPQQVPTNLTQNFQITPQQNITNELESRFANNIDEVKNTFVMKTGIFVDKDMKNLWLKNVNGDIRTFILEEVIEEDEKDLEIKRLRSELNQIKGMINNANEPVNSNINESIANEKPARVSSSKRTNAK